MPMLAPSDGWCDLLMGSEEEIVDELLVRVPFSVTKTPPPALLAGFAMLFMVATRGMRLERELLLGDKARLLVAVGASDRDSASL